MIEFTENDGAIIFTVRVVPRASKSELIGQYGGALKIRLAASPVDGEANKELVRLLARSFRVAKRDVKIIRGETSKTKLVKICGIGSDDFLKVIPH